VALLKDMTLETRMRHIRSSGRLNSRVAVAVEWADAGRNLRAEGYTVDIAPKGCLAVIPQGFTVGQKLRLINLINQISCEAVLVWRGHEGRTGWELGLEVGFHDNCSKRNLAVFHGEIGFPSIFSLPFNPLETYS
jgi:hypothetical protein